MIRPSPKTPYERKLLLAAEERFYAQHAPLRDGLSGLRLRTLRDAARRLAHRFAALAALSRVEVSKHPS